MSRCNDAFYDINDNRIISHPSYSGVYRDESEKLELYQEIMFFGVETKQKKKKLRCMLLM